MDFHYRHFRTLYRIGNDSLVRIVVHDHHVEDQKVLQSLGPRVCEGDWLANATCLQRQMASTLLCSLFWASTLVDSHIHRLRAGVFWPGISVNLMRTESFFLYVLIWSLVGSVIVGWVAKLGFYVPVSAYGIIRRLPFSFDFSHPDGILGLAPLTNFYVKIVALYFLDASLVTGVFVTLFSFGSFGFIALVSFPGVFGSLVFGYALHGSIADSREDLLRELHEPITILLDLLKLRANPSPSLVQFANIEALILTYREVREKSPWPLNVSLFGKALGLFASPTLTLLLKIVLQFMLPSAQL